MLLEHKSHLMRNRSIFRMVAAVQADAYSSMHTKTPAIVPRIVALRSGPALIYQVYFRPDLLLFFPPCSYDSEGRLTNVTFPTGVVTNLHGEMEGAITVDIETSGRDEDVSITTNLSSIDSFYTLVQGRPSTKKTGSHFAVLFFADFQGNMD